ncbi:MAG: hypothetical protein MUO58_05635 [Anaerolineales bacterium]|nr:hypothetical protein [Anaerolineales bacterium]
MSLKHVAFIVEYKRSGKVGPVAEAIHFLRGAETDQPNYIKLFIVPYMQKLGAKRCREANISWLDLSRNADIIGQDIRIYVDGRPNQFRQPGRPSNPFASKSSRVARTLLYNPGSSFIQRDLSRKTDLDEGYVSKIVSELEKLSLIERTGDGAVSMKNPALLLDAWEESYGFSKHTILRGHIPARSGEALLYSLGELFSGEMIKHAATGLAAAWLHTHFAAFRTVTFFVDESVNAGMLSKISFSEIEAGSNTWLVIPNDGSVYWGSIKIDGVQCVHPIQAYLDLKEHPERSEEAASQMHRLILPKSK